MNMFKNPVTKIFPRKESWIEKHHTFIITIGVILFMTLSLWIGLRQSVWFDEAYSILVARLPLGELLHMTALDTHPPLYYMLLHNWGAAFGWSELALRSFSVVTAGGAVAVGVLLVRRLFGVRAALITLPLLVFAPFLLRYGFEIRMYSLASFICISATYLLVVALQAKNKKQQWLLYGGYAALVALGVYTLYYTALIWLAHLVWLILLARKEKKPVIKSPWILAYVGSVLLFAPWIPTFVSQITNGALAPISQAITVDNLIGIVSFQFLYQPTWQLNALWSLVFIALVIAIVLLSVKAVPRIHKNEKKHINLLLAYFLVPIAILTLVSIARPMYVERYLAHVSIAMTLLVGVIMAYALRDGKRITQLLALLVLMVSVAGTVQLIQVGNFNFQRLQHPKVNLVADAINCRDGQTVLAADPYTAIELSYYLPASCDLRFYSETASLSGGYAPLSDSPKRVGDPLTELKGLKQLTYVYYDQPKLELPSQLHETETIGVGPMHISTFSAE